MAMADYYLCDICGEKTFYDATLDYDEDNRNPKTSHPWPNRDVGDMAVICRKCAETHKIELVKKS